MATKCYSRQASYTQTEMLAYTVISDVIAVTDLLFLQHTQDEIV